MEEKSLGPYQTPEKRRYVRFRCTMDIFTEISYGRDNEYLRQGGSGYLTIPGPERQRAKILDLSLGGSKVAARVPIRIGTMVTIRIETLYDGLIEGKGKIVWVKKANRKPNTYITGVEFEQFGWRHRFRLKKLIKQEIRT